MDAVFQAEQEHLNITYDKLLDIRRKAQERLAALSADASEEFAALRDELFLGSADADQIIEMQVEYELLNQIIDQHNLNYDINAERLSRAMQLLKRPYFAKVSLRFKPDAEPRDLYIGDAGMVDENRRHFILDWRSPVAEVYYNQDNGPTSYVANGRTITCDLLLRRQFDVTGNVLNAYFDTTVAIQDALLLEALMKRRSDKMTAITSTIQREQNLIIRHPDVPVLLVNGIAGSGKTSVLLQRIAYLFYTYRESLNPRQVCLITPNPVFRSYIDGVLPELGEANPQLVTWEELIARIGRLDRSASREVSVAHMREIRDAARAYQFGSDDFCDIKLGDEIVINANQARQAYQKHRHMPSKHGALALVCEDLEDGLATRIKNRANNEAAQGEMLDLSPEEQRRIFGHEVFPQTEEEFIELTTRYLKDRYAQVPAMIESAQWLRIDRIGYRLTGETGLSREEWAYLKMCLTGLTQRDVRFVMIDEVQDYTASQLMLMAECFPNAHFLLLGDENQAITPGTADFAQVRRVFEECLGARVDECRLMTSYRSTPEITACFAALMDPDAQIEVQSVQRPGCDPVVVVREDGLEYQAALASAVREALAGVAGEDVPEGAGDDASACACGADVDGVVRTDAGAAGVVAVIAVDDKAARRTQGLLAEEGIASALMDGRTALPKSGVAVFSVKTAKGLEFDEVIVANACAKDYPVDEVSRHRLYTAISRATRRVQIIAQGKLTLLLA